MKDNKNQKRKMNLWPIKVLLLAVFLSLTFSLISVLTLNKTNIIIAILIIMIFVAISILFDMIGLAVASCQIDPFTSMAARKVKGSKVAIKLIKNADKVSSICNDVVGDVCGILSGAAGASIIAKLAITSSSFMEIFIPSLISAIIAGLTIFGKASFKKIAIKYCNQITLCLARFISIFKKNK